MWTRSHLKSEDISDRIHQISVNAVSDLHTYIRLHSNNNQCLSICISFYFFSITHKLSSLFLPPPHPSVKTSSPLARVHAITSSLIYFPDSPPPVSPTHCQPVYLSNKHVGSCDSPAQNFSMAPSHLQD